MKERTQFNYAQRWKIEHSSHNRAKRKRNRGILTLTIVSVLVIAVLVSPWVWQSMLHYKLDQVDENIKVYHEVAATVEKIEELKAKEMRLDHFLQTIEENSKNPRRVISEITKLMPQGTIVNSYTLQADNTVQIGLVLLGPIDVAKLWINFRDSGLFVDFDLMNVSLADDKQNLSLTLSLKQ